MTPARPTTRVTKTRLAQIQPLRARFLQESHFQVRYDACHGRGWTDSYLLEVDGQAAGYGSIKGQEIRDRDTVFEFYVVPTLRHLASTLFRELLQASQARWIEAQTNDRLMSALLFEFGDQINANVVLFGAGAPAGLVLPGATFRQRRRDDRVFEHSVEPVGDYVVELDGQIVGTGGFLLHYNEPFADVFMEVAETHRRRGVGSFLVQEVMKGCVLAGRVPAARTAIDNIASRATLLKAGMTVCGFLLKGVVRGVAHGAPSA